MSLFGDLLGIASAVAMMTHVGWGIKLALLLGKYAVDQVEKSKQTPTADEQGVQREMVLSAQAQIPVVYGRALVAPRLVHVTTSGVSNQKLYLVGVLSEGEIAAIEEIFLDGNVAVRADGTTKPNGIFSSIEHTSLETPCVVTTEFSHELDTGDVVHVETTQLHGDYTVTVVDATHFSIPAETTIDDYGSLNPLTPGYRKSDGTSLIRFAKYLGTDTQNTSADPGETDGPTADSTLAIHDVPGQKGALSGLAYLVLEIIYDADRFPNGVPEVTVTVKGRTVYDPRDASTAWSDNPVLCYRDYLSDGARYGASSGAIRYGLGIAAADIFDGVSDTEGLRLLADYCDEVVACPAGTGLMVVSSTTNTGDLFTTARAHGLAPSDKVWIRGVTATPALEDGEYTVATTPATDTFTLTDVTFSADGGSGGTVQKATTQARYSCNGVIDTARTVQENLNAILSSCRGFIAQEGGRWGAVLTRAGITPSSFTLDATNIIGDWEFSTPDTAEVPNLIQAKHAPLRGATETVEWPPTTVTNPYLEDDAYISNSKNIELPMTQDYYQAQRLARCVLEEARNKLFVGVTASEAALVLSIGDLVYLTHATPAWTDKLFWVIGIRINPNATTRLLLMQYLETAYDEKLTDDAPCAGTALPLPWYVAPATGLVLTTGTNEPRIKATWTASTDALAWRYEVEARRSDEGTWRGFGFVSADTVTAFISPVQHGEVWTVRVRTVRRVGTRSDWVEDDHTVGLIGASLFEYAVTADGSGVDYALTFGVNCETIELYTVAHAASGGANPEVSVLYLAARIARPTSGQVTQRIATTANYYRRTKIISYNATGLKGQESDIIETQANVTGSGPSGAPSGLAEVSGGTGTDYINIEWTNGDATATTRVWVDGTVIYTAAAGDTTYTISGLSPSATIQVDVDHFKNGQASAKNGVVEMTTDGATLDAPTGFVSHGMSGGPPYLWAGWAMGANAEGAQTVVEASEIGDFSDAIELTDASPTPPGATSLASSTGLLTVYTTYTFRAKHTRTGSTDSDWSDTDTATYGGDDV